MALCFPDKDLKSLRFTCQNGGHRIAKTREFCRLPGVTYLRDPILGWIFFRVSFGMFFSALSPHFCFRGRSRKEGRKEETKERRTKRRKEGSKEERKEETKEERKEGTKEGRKEGRKEETKEERK